MKVEIINKAMLCWDNNESQAKEYHVLAKVTECDTKYPFKVICNENTSISRASHYFHLVDQRIKMAYNISIICNNKFINIKVL